MIYCDRSSVGARTFMKINDQRHGFFRQRLVVNLFSCIFGRNFRLIHARFHEKLKEKIFLKPTIENQSETEVFRQRIKYKLEQTFET